MLRIEPYMTQKDERRLIARDEKRLLDKSFDVMSLCFYSRLRAKQAEKVITRLQSAIDVLKSRQIPPIELVDKK